jgi:hypothetical protein
MVLRAGRTRTGGFLKDLFACGHPGVIDEIAPGWLVPPFRFLGCELVAVMGSFGGPGTSQP